jgi:hypothetical protein
MLFLVAAAALLLYQSYWDAKIARRQRTALGTVVAHDIKNHDSYSYTFGVGPHLYTGRNGVPAKPPAVGDRIVVFYDPEAPARSSLSRFGELSDTTAGPIAILLVAAALVGFLAIRRC